MNYVEKFLKLTAMGAVSLILFEAFFEAPDILPRLGI